MKIIVKDSHKILYSVEIPASHVISYLELIRTYGYADEWHRTYMFSSATFTGTGEFLIIMYESFT